MNGWEAAAGSTNAPHPITTKQKEFPMKLKAIKDPIGGYRVAGTDIIWARQNECRCCWYVLDESETETIAYANSYAQAKEAAFKFVETR